MSQCVDSKGETFYPMAGVNIYFPPGKEPFAPQRNVMSRLVTALKKGEHALLESPTGTGKTLALLCASLAWQRSPLSKEALQKQKAERSEEDEEPDDLLPPSPSSPPRSRRKHNDDHRNRVPTIFFCSRTHSQLAQVVAELRTLESTLTATRDSQHAPPFKMTILGSRDQFCINADVKSNARHGRAGINDLCKKACKEKACIYKEGFEKRGGGCVPEIWDMEDLFALGKQRVACPYFLSRSALEGANLVIAPFNYIIEPGIRASMGVDLEGSVVIFDEGHNISQFCRDAASMDLNVERMNDMLRRLTSLIRGKFHAVLEVLVGINDWLQSRGDEIDSDAAFRRLPPGKEYCRYYGVQEGLELFTQQMGIDGNLVLSALSDMHAFNNYLENIGGDGNTDLGLSSADGREIERILGSLDLFLKPGNAEHFRLCSSKVKGDDNSLNLSLLCMTASLIFRDIAKQSWSVILTSGTLSPLETFAGELGAEFKVTTKAAKFVDAAHLRTQCFSAVVSAYQKVTFEGTSAGQRSDDYMRALASLLENSAKKVRGGILLFLPSYGLSKYIQRLWNQWGVIESIRENGQKRILFEGDADFKILLDRHYEAVEESRTLGARRLTGSIIVAVYRGRISEGMDFSDDYARLSLVVGIPYAYLGAPAVRCKKSYQDIRHMRDNNLHCNGGAWYAEDAFRALNQAVGRCLRHRTDYGAIIFVDHRAQTISKNVSSWLQGLIDQSIESGEELMTPLGDFLTKAGARFDGQRVLPIRSKFGKRQAQLLKDTRSKELEEDSSETGSV